MPAALIVGGLVGSALISADANRHAANQAKDAAQQSANYADPFHGSRAYWGDQLNSFMGKNGQGSAQSSLSALQNSPSYQFRYNQGLSALNSSLAAKGMLNSGNRLAALTNYGQDYASQEYQNQFNRLDQLSGDKNANLGAAADSYSGQMKNSIGYGVQQQANYGQAFNSLMSGIAGGMGGSGGGAPTGGTASYNFNSAPLNYSMSNGQSNGGFL